MTTTPSSGSHVIRFAAFELEPRTGELRKHGLRIKLQIQPFQVLQILLENAGEVVTREELQRKIWPADTFVDFDHGLNNAIRRLREALNDSAESPRFIETLAKRGYRFIARVEEVGDGARTAAVPAPAATVDSIVVLPFVNMSADAEDEFFADGITEEIINALTQIEQLHVVARSSTFSFKGKHIDARMVGDQLNVRTVLEGSVRRADHRLRITVKLVNAADGYHLWSERYDREMKDIFDIQDEIARSVAERLKVTLEGGGTERLVKAGTTNLEAYRLYVKGRVLIARRGPAASYLDCFERAVKLDPNYAQAWAGLADSYTVLGYTGLVRPEASMPKAVEAARRAVALGSSLAEAHNALAMASLMGTRDRAEAEREFLRALKLNPRYIQARDWYGLFYLQFSEGRLAEGVAQTKLALRYDPLSSYAHAAYGFTCAWAGRHSEALEACERGVELDSESYLARFILQAALYLAGEFEESIAVGEVSLAMSGRHPWSMVYLGATFADCGKTSAAEAIYAEMLARSRCQYVPPALLAVAASAASCEDGTIHHARMALEMRDPHCLFFFSIHTGQTRWHRLTGRMYGYPKFREIIAQMGRNDWLRD